MRRSLFVIICILGCASTLFASQTPVPELRARVTDLTATLTPDQRDSLERKLRTFEQNKGSQIAVLFVPTTGDETIEQYTMRVAETWKIGRSGADDGVILVVAKNDRELRIEVGYGLEGAVPDALARQIIDELIVPRFRSGDYFDGTAAGVEALIAAVSGEPVHFENESGYNYDDAYRAWTLIGFALWLGFIFVSSHFRRWVIVAVVTAIVGFAVALPLFGNLEDAVDVQFFLWFALLLHLSIVGLIKLFGKKGDGSAYSGATSGGAVGGFFRSGYSSSSFSGGGGSFGGGGASGSW
ncbi:MAG: YgcG family protein [Ignavibacteriales bacterium]|nr:YgcG family protein [Ignavibacteriales bacterium]